MRIFSILNSTRMMRFVLAIIFVMSIAFIYLSYPLTRNFVPEVHLADLPSNLNRVPYHLIFRNINKVPNVRKEEPLIPMNELNNTGEFGLDDYKNQNIIVAAQESLRDNIQSNTSLEYNMLRAEDIYVSGHLMKEISKERICPMNGKDIELLILITSKRANMESRMAIRNTWGKLGNRMDVSMAFVLGDGLDDVLSLSLSEENYEYGDLIRGNFLDTYTNLTLKTISYLEWVDNYCNRAKYILKTDDDVFINVPRLMKFLSKRKKKRVIYGRRMKYSKKPFDTWFCTGPAYVLSGDIIHDLYVQALKTHFMQNEDVFVTGIVANILRIKRIHANSFYNRPIPFSICFVQNAISIHSVNYRQQFRLWTMLRENLTCNFSIK